MLEGAFTDGTTEVGPSDNARTHPGTRLSLRSDTGCELLCWSDGPAVFPHGSAERLYLPPVRAPATI